MSVAWIVLGPEKFQTAIRNKSVKNAMGQVNHKYSKMAHSTFKASKLNITHNRPEYMLFLTITGLFQRFRGKNEISLR